MFKLTNFTVTAAIALAALAGAAHADGKRECTTEPQAKWKPAAEAEAAAKTAGYTVSKSKIEGTCYEVYAAKDGKNFELFYNPIDLKLAHTVTK
ncbi:MAG: PepSY domain-containing protein [Hyphomicrobium sp.]